MKKRYNGMNDIIFKNTFYIEKNKDLLKWLIESCLDIKIDEIELKDKEKYHDLIITSEIILLTFKSNRNLFYIQINIIDNQDYIREKCLDHLSKIYKNVVNESLEIPNVIQVNFINKSKSSNDVTKFVLKNEYDVLWTNKFIIYEFDLSNIKEKYFNGDNEYKERFKPIVMLTSSNHELEKLCIGDDRVKRYKDRVDELNDDPEYTVLMSDEEDDKKLKATRDYLWNLKLKDLDEQKQQLDDQKQKLDDQKQ